MTTSIMPGDRRGRAGVPVVVLAGLFTLGRAPGKRLAGTFSRPYFKELVVRTWIQPLILVMFMQALAASVQAQTLGSTMQVYVFPKQGQDAAPQFKDEASCYDWAVRGRRAASKAEARAEQQAAASAAQREQAADQSLTNFKNAFSVCLEAKDYMVKG
jgi:hypothetical protein